MDKILGWLWAPFKAVWELFPKRSSFNDHTDQANLKTITWIIIVLVIVSIPAFYMFSGGFIDAVEAGDRASAAESGAQLVALICSVFLAGLVFVWSWGSFASTQNIIKQLSDANEKLLEANKEIVEKLNKTSHGRMIRFEHVGEHISEFVSALTGNHEDKSLRRKKLSSVKNIKLMLSTPLYGIEAQGKGAAYYMALLVRSLREWVDHCTKNSQEQELEICIWEKNPHRAIWAAPEDPNEPAARWYSDKTENEIRDCLYVMIEFCQLMIACINHEHAYARITSKVKLVNANDTRLFLLQRTTNDYFGMNAIFTSFGRVGEVRTTGFVVDTEESFGWMEELRLLYSRDSGHLEEKAENLRPSTIRHQPFKFISEYYGLQPNWYGFESMEVLSREHPNWWNLKPKELRDVFNVETQVSILSFRGGA